MAEADAYGTTLLTVFGKRGERSAATQASYQVAALGCTLAIAIAGGALTGAVCRALPVLERFYDDSVEYDAPKTDSGLQQHGSGVFYHDADEEDVDFFPAGQLNDEEDEQPTLGQTGASFK